MLKGSTNDKEAVYDQSLDILKLAWFFYPIKMYKLVFSSTTLLDTSVSAANGWLQKGQE